MALRWERLYWKRREKGIGLPVCVEEPYSRTDVQSTLLAEEIPGHIHACLAVIVLASVTKYLTQDAFRPCSLLWHYSSTHIETISGTVLRRKRARLPMRKDPVIAMNSTRCFQTLWAFVLFIMFHWNKKIHMSFRICNIVISLSPWKYFCLWIC